MINYQLRLFVQYIEVSVRSGSYLSVRQISINVYVLYDLMSQNKEKVFTENERGEKKISITKEIMHDN